MRRTILPIVAFGFLAAASLVQSEPMVSFGTEKNDETSSTVFNGNEPRGRSRFRVRSVFHGRTQKSDSVEADPAVQQQAVPSPSEPEYLKEIATILAIPVLVRDTPGDIAFKIKQRLGTAERYRGKVLADDAFEKAKSAIRIPSDAETFADYHVFIKKVAGKRILILNAQE